MFDSADMFFAHMMPLCANLLSAVYFELTYDHGVVDGREAATFLVRVKEALEDPARLVLDL
jgi:pyruvate/2-oxoglutarate dehydrogenase complex dihydrolipoamide acyltransferase (E2) component